MLKANKRDQTVVTQNINKFITNNSLQFNMNTSMPLVHALDEIVKSILQVAIQSAYNDGRKTVMDRDLYHIKSAIMNLGPAPLEGWGADKSLVKTPCTPPPQPIPESPKKVDIKIELEETLLPSGVRI